MNWLELMKERHSVRQYMDKPVPDDIRLQLSEEVTKLNQQSGLDMQIFFDEPHCFHSGMAHYGNFTGVVNYLAVIGKKRASLEEEAGYYGERFVLFLQSLGLNSCWVALTHGKSAADIRKDEKQLALIAFGYGVTGGNAHHDRPMNELCQVNGEMPDWFQKGMEGAMLAPTAMNQQKFLISYDGNKLAAAVNGRGFYTNIDLGIVRCHFELASGHHFDA